MARRYLRTNPIVAVIRTGAGKSLCFMLLAAVCSGGVTQPYAAAEIVFVTPESAITKESRRLDRIVVDECYTILEGKKDFRPKLRVYVKPLYTPELVKQQVRNLPAKVIIYYTKVEATKLLSATLRCNAYYRELGTKEDKSHLLKAWMSGEPRLGRYGDGRVIVATNAMGLGIDVPDVRLVVHSGRAGRDGKPSEAVAFIGEA
ncbi:P-loop containing nucleoside triphosphate hydrolase protein [Truncatella angustata]|uniref:DNA 3'-5' helicase n=1 Tax=Truncatella angustata TaxID=152316 RepID=A0A9P8RL08_9PEZI|nr:P-loop containing nucleoside triphosphate hydrolase protein [Truncatella angustata]KAH6645235.1 P-loop containing nucleoside triphosphate hydrolase protein [Truncatella angustata]